MNYVPKIEPVADGHRPLWSVMIPAYNGGDYLATTVRSVLAQDPGPETMQIEVVDDHSLKEDLRRVVEDVGQGRVVYFRQPKNVGLVENFNTCVRRSRGHWVHILHGDDMVLPGFYEKLRVAAGQPGVGAAFCRYLWMNEDDHWSVISELERGSAGVLQGWIEKIGVTNRIQAPAVVVARRAYEEIGGFNPEFFHCADWDMWKRIACQYPVWYEPSVLACYRTHSNSDTSQLMRTGKNIEDIRRSITMAKEYLPKPVAEVLSKRAYKTYAHFALISAESRINVNDFSAGIAQTREALKTCHSWATIGAFAGLVFRFSLQFPSRVYGTLRRRVRSRLNGAKPKLSGC